MIDIFEDFKLGADVARYTQSDIVRNRQNASLAEITGNMTIIFADSLLSQLYVASYSA